MGAARQLDGPDDSDLAAAGQGEDEGGQDGSVGNVGGMPMRPDTVAGLYYWHWQS